MGAVRVDYRATDLTVTEPEVLHWIDTARRAVTGYRAAPGDGGRDPRWRARPTRIAPGLTAARSILHPAPPTVGSRRRPTTD